jgi:hypothetical protein
LKKKSPPGTSKKKGWTGPNICLLCYRDEETTNHLFSQCCFTRLVWDRLKLDNKSITSWTGTSISSCFDHWISNEHYYKLLPPLVNWFIWKARNSKIFDDKQPSINVVAYKALGLFQNWKDIHPGKKKKKRL